MVMHAGDACMLEHAVASLVWHVPDISDQTLSDIGRWIEKLGTLFTEIGALVSFPDTHVR